MFCDVVYNNLPSRIVLNRYKHMHVRIFTLYIHAYLSTHTTHYRLNTHTGMYRLVCLHLCTNLRCQRPFPKWNKFQLNTFCFLLYQV
jgi:hypothetical protein